MDALRHAGVRTRVLSVRVQRDPFSERGSRVDAFVSDRFGTSRLHHVEITFSEPISGPLVIGDGRWLGLGLLQPVRDDAEQTAETMAGEALESVDDDLDAEEGDSVDEAGTDS
jgi:CRISPR-associated protein Csb2